MDGAEELRRNTRLPDDVVQLLGPTVDEFLLQPVPRRLRQVIDGVTLCNKLILSKLQSRANLPDTEVHLVCLAGNGCRYPLIQEELKKRLRVAFLDRDPDRFHRRREGWRVRRGGDGGKR